MSTCGFITNPTQYFDFCNVEILDTADSDSKLRIKELLHILSRNPELNKQLGSQSNYEIKTLIIIAYPNLDPRSNGVDANYS